MQNKNLEKKRKNVPANKKLSWQSTGRMGGKSTLFLRNCEELSIAGMCDVAEEGSFKKAEKFAAPREVLRLSRIGVSVLGWDWRSMEGHGLYFCSVLTTRPSKRQQW